MKINKHVKKEVEKNYKNSLKENNVKNNKERKITYKSKKLQKRRRVKI